MSASAWLMLVALALYVYDAAWLLGPQELVLVRARRGRWQPQLGIDGWRLRGREVFVPNLLMPWRAHVRAIWQAADGTRTGAAALPAGQVGAGIAIGACAIFLLMVLALPYALFIRVDSALALLVMAAIYLACMVTLALVWWQRQALGMSSREAAKLCFECLTCPPFCINIVRKLSLREVVTWPLDAVTSLVSSDEHAHTAFDLQLASRIRYELSVEPEGSARAASLARTLASLKTGEPG